jgi:hypothetical protein
VNGFCGGTNKPTTSASIENTSELSIKKYTLEVSQIDVAVIDH